MSKDTHSQKTFIIVSLFLLLLSTSLCLVISTLAGYSITDVQQLALFRQRLLLSTLGIYLLFFGGYFLYQRKPTIKQSATPIKSSARTISHSMPLRILAVDDNSANLLVIEKHLATQNIPVIAANSGIEALTIIESQPVDLILMDIEMHGMDGIQTTRTIRSQEKSRTPIIAVSAHSESSKRLEILAGGFDDFLAKPITTNTLLAMIERWSHAPDIVSMDTTRTTTVSPNISLNTTRLDTAPVDFNPLRKASSTKKPVHKPNILQKSKPPEKTIKKVIDINTSLEHSNHNNALAKDMLDLLIQMIKEEKKNIALFHHNQDWNSLYKLNHKIYGGSSYCGVPALQSANQTLEKLLQPALYFDEEIPEDEQDDTDILTALDSCAHIQKIDHAVTHLLSAIDDIIVWDEEYDTGIVFDVDDS